MRTLAPLVPLLLAAATSSAQAPRTSDAPLAGLLASFARLYARLNGT